MNYFILILSIILMGCSSKEKKYQELEDKLDKLTKLMEKQASGEKDKVDNKNDNYDESSSMKIILPSVQPSDTTQHVKKVILGEKNGNHFEFMFNNGNYWVKVNPQTINYSEMELRILGKDNENPETISLAQVDGNTFQGAGDSRLGLTNLELHYRVKQRKTIIINFDLNFKE